MSTKIETIAPTPIVRECARDGPNRRLLPVSENGKLIGVATDRYICCSVVAKGRDPATVTVEEIMASDVASCLEVQDCTEAVRVTDERVRRLPVVNRQQAMISLLSVDDLARYSHDLAGPGSRGGSAVAALSSNRAALRPQRLCGAWRADAECHA
jgi:CBS domain-containing protein